jgi:hypothetical protein
MAANGGVVYVRSGKVEVRGRAIAQPGIVLDPHGRLVTRS